MKQYYFLILPVLMLCMACDDVTTSDLVGKWQLKTVEKNGTETVVDTVWYNFQSESVFLMQIYVSQGDDYLFLYGLKRQNDNNLSIRLEFEDHIESSDWESRERSFTIEKLSKKKLTLRSEDGYLYSFIKF
ncbi:MAG: lipocalin-like domain-containing protein [Tannerella sp.]|nr:lipocalin-like domain-containing protein [Tannerella sp.]